MPLANALLTKEQLNQPEETYPLELVFCPSCTLVQITETVPPEKLFREYPYFSSFSDTMLNHSQELARRMISERRLNGHSLVLEVASNDGYLLQYYKERSIPVLGIEPAANVARVAQKERGIPTITEFFNAALARQIRDGGQRADVIHAHNVLGHVANLNEFVQGIQLLLKDEGVAIIEVPYVQEMIDRVEFDTIYHEHLCYFSLKALDNLFRRHALMVQDVELIPIHGGSVRLSLAKTSGAHRISSRVSDLLIQESNRGMDRLDFYRGFHRKVNELKGSLRRLLLELKGGGKCLAAYGAAAKGTTLLNYFGLGQDILDFVVDRSTHKQGRYMPGVHLLIYSPGELLNTMPDYVLLLTWNFTEEILAQQTEYRRLGGHFIIPVPQVAIV